MENTKSGGLYWERVHSESGFGPSSLVNGHFFVSKLSTPNCAQNGPKWHPKTVGLIEGRNGPKNAQICPMYLPRVPSQSVLYHFWAKPLLTIFGPEIGHFGGPVRWATKSVLSAAFPSHFNRGKKLPLARFILLAKSVTRSHPPKAARWCYNKAKPDLAVFLPRRGWGPWVCNKPSVVYLLDPRNTDNIECRARPPTLKCKLCQHSNEIGSWW